MQIMVELPQAARDYLGWMMFWREVEIVMQKDSVLEVAASMEAAYLRGEVADALSEIVQEITL